MKKIYLSLTLFLGSLVGFGQIIITELADPNDNSGARFVELYNLGASSVDLSTGWKINRYTNDNSEPQTAEALTGIIEAGGFYIISNGASGFNAAYGFDPDQDIGTSDAADSNGDDQIFLLNPSDEIVDFFGVPGEDGTGTCHEFEDGRAERKASVTVGAVSFDESEWNIWADSNISGCTSHTNDAQNVIDMDPGSWIGQPATTNPEPSNHVTSFTATTSGIVQIDLTWSDNNGSQAAEGFLLYASTGVITSPSDGVEVAVDGDLSDGSAVVDLNSGVESYSFTSLIPSTLYNFEIYPYSNFGDNIDYKTDATVPSQSISTPSSTYSSGDIVISEIMYDTPSADEEWVEIYNGSGASIELDADWEISNANPSWSYTFDGSITLADGEYISIQVGTDGSFPFTPDISFNDVTGNQLNNSSSEISILAEGVLIDEVSYTEDLAMADGGGSSLALGSLLEDNSDMTYWIGSATVGGTPGAANDVTVWTATSSTDWLNAGNWSNGVPSATLSAIVVSGGSSPMIADDVEMASLKVGSGVDLIISAGTVVINDEFILDGFGEVFSGASLAILGDETGSGDITIFRNTNGNVGYSIIGSPVSDAELTNLSADYLYGYSELDSSFPVPTGSMVPGVGYFVGYNGSSPSVSLTGNPNSGTVTSTITLEGAGFNLVANPYAAAISMSSLRTGNDTDIDGVFYLWDDGGTNVGADRGGDYITASIAEVVGGSVGLEGTSAASLGNIASVQGFFVRANNAGSVSFTPDMQVTTTGANVDANHYREASSEKQSIRLSISGNGLYNEILVGLRDDATLGMDIGLDALKFSGNELIAFYSMIEDQKFAIQTLPKLSSESIEVQLGIDLAEAGSYKLNINEMVGFNENTSVILVDNLTGKFYDLNEVSEIDFINNESVFTSKRFELVLAPAAVLSSEIVLDDSEMVVFTNDLGLNIITSEAFSNAEIKVYSLSGSVVSSYSNVDFSNKEWATSFDKKGLFILKIESENGLMIKKFLN